jgi:hypothetical protein
MASEPRAILELPDGTRYQIEGRTAWMIIAIAYHQGLINGIDKGLVELAFDGNHLHPLRISQTLQITSLPSVLE